VDGNCSKCGVFTALAASNKSRKTGAQLYRSWCRACEKARKDAWRHADPERHNKKSRAWVDANPEKRAETSRRYRAKAPQEVAKKLRQEWRKANPERARAQVNARRKSLRVAMPKSLTEFDRLHISELYHLAQLRGLTVDHIVPISHPLVCGLHAPWNLQLLPATENYRKSNEAPGLRAMRKLPGRRPLE
jgi:5-methylcytosine-specific restriction endonuclease McrA